MAAARVVSRSLNTLPAAGRVRHYVAMTVLTIVGAWAVGSALLAVVLGGLLRRRNRYVPDRPTSGAAAPQGSDSASPA